MPFYTDSDNNAFIGTTLFNSWDNFRTNFQGGLDAILLSAKKYAMLNWTNYTEDPLTYNYPVFAWTPDLPGETLTTTANISINAPWYDHHLTRAFIGEFYETNYYICPPRTARFTTMIYRTDLSGGGTYSNDSIIQVPESYMRFVSANISIPRAFGTWPGPIKHYLTIAKNEIHYFCSDVNYTRSQLVSSGMLLNPTLPFSNHYSMNACVNRISFNGANNGVIYNKGYMPWINWANIYNLVDGAGDYPLACSNGTTFGTDLMLTDYAIRSDNAQYNHPYRGIWKNLKLAVGPSIAVGRKYHCVVDAGSPKWLCLGKYSATSDKYVMMRVYE